MNTNLSLEREGREKRRINFRRAEKCKWVMPLGKLVGEFPDQKGEIRVDFQKRHGHLHGLSRYFQPLDKNLVGKVLFWLLLIVLRGKGTMHSHLDSSKLLRLMTRFLHSYDLSWTFKVLLLVPCALVSVLPTIPHFRRIV